MLNSPHILVLKQLRSFSFSYYCMQQKLVPIGSVWLSLTAAQSQNFWFYHPRQDIMQLIPVSMHKNLLNNKKIQIR